MQTIDITTMLSLPAYDPLYLSIYLDLVKFLSAVLYSF